MSDLSGSTTRRSHFVAREEVSSLAGAPSVSGAPASCGDTPQRPGRGGAGVLPSGNLEIRHKWPLATGD